MLISCNSVQKQHNQEQQGDFVHAVYFWLKNPDSEEDRKLFESSLLRFINSSEYVMSKHIGKPAATNREVIDNSYTYSLVLSFKDKADQDKYQEESAHKKFIEEASHLWEKVLVYDSEKISDN